MYHAQIFKLLPGGPCEDYVYRFRVLGRYESEFDTKKAAAAWWENCVQDIEFDSSWPHDFAKSGWSGWHKESGVGIRLIRSDSKSGSVMTEEMNWWQLKNVVRHGAALK